MRPPHPLRKPRLCQRLRSRVHGHRWGCLHTRNKNNPGTVALTQQNIILHLGLPSREETNAAELRSFQKIENPGQKPTRRVLTRISHRIQPRRSPNAFGPSRLNV
eukprot:8520117-Pyramimonas_sp.AAC.1